MMSTQRRMRSGSRRVATAPAPPPDDDARRGEYSAVMAALGLQAAPTTAAPTRPPVQQPPARSRPVDEAAMRAVLQAVITPGGSKRAAAAAAAAGAEAVVAVPEPLVDRVRINNILHRMRTVRPPLAPFHYAPHQIPKSLRRGIRIVLAANDRETDAADVDAYVCVCVFVGGWGVVVTVNTARPSPRHGSPTHHGAAAAVRVRHGQHPPRECAHRHRGDGPP